jgi:holo-[acyl-carrier protein] synthase
MRSEFGVRSLESNTPNPIKIYELKSPNTELIYSELMIFGTGIDIVNIERIEQVMARWGDLFLDRVFTEKEIFWCQRRARPSECFAVFFAAKEAFLKAIGTGLRNGIQWTDIEVEHEPSGKPRLSFRRKAKELLETNQIQRTLVTLSHDRPCAVAHVILEGRNDEGSDR